MQSLVVKHERDGTLMRVKPAPPPDDVKRKLSVGSELFPALTPWSLPKDQKREMYIRPQLDVFVSGGLINIGWNPRDKDSSAHIARTDPPYLEVWDIRCTARKPGIRVFGRFVEFNHFVALTYEYREQLESDADWTRAQERCKQKWQNLFPDQPLFSPTKASGYVSEPYAIV